MKKATVLAAVALLVLSACGKKEADGQVSASGVIECTEVNIAAKVPGIIREVLPREGDRLVSGQVVAVIDSADLQWQQALAEASLQVARANLQLAVNGPQREDIAQADAAAQQANIQLEAASLDLARARQLAETGTAPAKQFDDAQTRVRSAEATLAMARASQAKSRAGTRAESIAAARAQVAMADAGLKAISQRITDCTVRTPVAGTVTERIAEPGEMATPGGVLVTLSALDSVWLKVYLTTMELANVHLGDSVDVVLDGKPDAPYRGNITWISPAAEFTPKNVQTKEDRVKLVFALKIGLANPHGDLKPGLPADAVFHPNGPRSPQQ